MRAKTRLKMVFIYVQLIFLKLSSHVAINLILKIAESKEKRVVCSMGTGQTRSIVGNPFAQLARGSILTLTFLYNCRILCDSSIQFILAGNPIAQLAKGVRCFP